MKIRTAPCLLALAIAAASFVPAAAAEPDQEDQRRKWLMRQADPYVAFVPDRPWLVATERSQGTVLILRYPELEVVKTLASPSGEKLLNVESSPDGRWLAGYFGDDSLRVWDATAGEVRLTLDAGSRAVAFHPDEARLVTWQPDVGITQWALEEGERVGPVISSLDHVLRDDMALSSDGRYLLMYGRCRAQDTWWDFCVYDLGDGSTVAWTDDLALGLEEVDLENEEEFLEILRATRLTDLGGSACTRLDEDRALCCAGSVALVEPQAAPSSARAEAMHEFPGRYVWEIRPGKKHVGARVLNSCARSADGRWVAVGAGGEEVLLFDTEELLSKSMAFGAYTWRQPVLVRRFEMPF